MVWFTPWKAEATPSGCSCVYGFDESLWYVPKNVCCESAQHIFLCYSVVPTIGGVPPTTRNWCIYRISYKQYVFIQQIDKDLLFFQVATTPGHPAV